jgi:hypothetical protein
MPRPLNLCRHVSEKSCQTFQILRNFTVIRICESALNSISLVLLGRVEDQHRQAEILIADEGVRNIDLLKKHSTTVR